MSKTASLTLQPSRGLIDRIVSFLDLAAVTAARNADPIAFGL